MKTILLNIGMARKGQPDLTTGQVRAALVREDISLLQHATHVSTTEQTFVARVILPASPDTRHEAAEGDVQALYRVAQRLSQDCIAAWDGSAGILVGPNAAAWGEFNGKFFLNLNGTTLQ